MQLRDIDRDPHPHDLAAVALSLQVIKTFNIITIILDNIFSYRCLEG